MSSSKVYIGNLGENGDRDRIWKTFSTYGTLRDVWVARNPPGFAFVEFEDPRDAEEAVYKMDGKKVCDKHVRVELSHRRGGRDRGERGDRGSSRGYRGGGGGGGGGRRYDQDGGSGYRGDRGGRYSPPRRRSRSPPPRGGRDRSPVGGHYSRRSRSRSPPRQLQH